MRLDAMAGGETERNRRGRDESGGFGRRDGELGILLCSSTWTLKF